MDIQDYSSESQQPRDSEFITQSPKKQSNFIKQTKITSTKDLFRSVSRKEVEEMIDKVRSQINKNKKKYDKLTNINPYFTIKLYQPHHQFTTNQDNSYSIKLLMQQIDLLLDEANFLDKQIKKCQLKRMQSDYRDPNQREEVKHHFSYLRKIWVEAGKVQSKNDLQRIQQLNKRVVLIKNNVFQLSQHQRNCYNINQKVNYSLIPQFIKQAVEKSQEYISLKQKYQNSRMKIEQMQGRVQRMCDRHNNELAQKDKDIIKVMKQNDQLRKQNKQLKEKMIVSQKKEMKLLEKINLLEQQIRLKSKSQVAQSQNLANPSHPHFAQIRFRKIQLPHNIILDPLPENSIQINSPTLKKKDFDNIQLENQQFAGRQSLPLHNIEDRLQSHLMEAYTPRKSLLAENKSSDKKGGRFIRMRSPGNSRLLKEQGTGQNSQKSRDTQYSSTNSITSNQK